MESLFFKELKYISNGKQDILDTDVFKNHLFFYDVMPKTNSATTGEYENVFTMHIHGYNKKTKKFLVRYSFCNNPYVNIPLLVKKYLSSFFTFDNCFIRKTTYLTYIELIGLIRILASKCILALPSEETHPSFLRMQYLFKILNNNSSIRRDLLFVAMTGYAMNSYFGMNYYIKKMRQHLKPLNTKIVFSDKYNNRYSTDEFLDFISKKENHHLLHTFYIIDS